MLKTDRRDFIKTAAIGSAAALAIPAIVTDALAATSIKKISLNEHDVVLFQGDSITDANRDRKQLLANTTYGMGSGYAFIAGSSILMNNPKKQLLIYNRGISGDKVFQLSDRWDADCLQLKPNVLSILIGVNDHWAVKKHGYTGTIDTYRDDYRRLLDRTKKALPEAKIVIGEPFAVTGVKEVDETWFPKFDEFRVAAKLLSDEFNTAFIPYQAIFNKAVETAPGSFWTVDGVHPNMAGAQLMAHAVLNIIR